MSEAPTRGRPRASPRVASHGRVESARQALVNAEEAYLTANEWQRVQIGEAWMWQRTAGFTLVMQRIDAVKFQHNLGEPKA